jgi:DNA-binding phage protein
VSIAARVQRDARFRRSLLKEAIDTLLSGGVDTGKTVLRDYINATQGFEELAAAIHKSPKSLMRMLGPRGNPRASNLLEILAHLQQREGLCSTVTSVRHDRNREQIQ